MHCKLGLFFFSAQRPSSFMRQTSYYILVYKLMVAECRNICQGDCDDIGRSFFQESSATKGLLLYSCWLLARRQDKQRKGGRLVWQVNWINHKWVHLCKQRGRQFWLAYPWRETFPAMGTAARGQRLEHVREVWDATLVEDARTMKGNRDVVFENLYAAYIVRLNWLARWDSIKKRTTSGKIVLVF